MSAEILVLVKKKKKKYKLFCKIPALFPSHVALLTRWTRTTVHTIMMVFVVFLACPSGCGNVSRPHMQLTAANLTYSPSPSHISLLMVIPVRRMRRADEGSGKGSGRLLHFVFTNFRCRFMWNHACVCAFSFCFCCCCCWYLWFVVTAYRMKPSN